MTGHFQGRKFAALAAVALMLAACEATPPDRGAGFSSLNDLQPIPQSGLQTEFGTFVESRQISQERALVLQGETPIEELQPVDSLEALAAAAIDEAEAGQGETAVVPVTPGQNAGISDEQDFDAVASRESIESNAERLVAQREAYQVIQPGALPSRPGSNEPSIVAFALATSHAPGVPMYQRIGISGQGRFDRNCAKYPSSDIAQEAFLAAGGPERDRYGIDPDGDGYACYWDPTPFRAALSQ